MKALTYSIAVAAGLCTAAASQADTFVWNFDTPTGSVASPHTYADLTSTFNITAAGFTTHNHAPNNASLGDVWDTGDIAEPTGHVCRIARADGTVCDFDFLTLSPTTARRNCSSFSLRARAEATSWRRNGRSIG